MGMDDGLLCAGKRYSLNPSATACWRPILKSSRYTLILCRRPSSKSTGKKFNSGMHILKLFHTIEQISGGLLSSDVASGVFLVTGQLAWGSVQWLVSTPAPVKQHVFLLGQFHILVMVGVTVWATGRGHREGSCPRGIPANVKPISWPTGGSSGHVWDQPGAHVGVGCNGCEEVVPLRSILSSTPFGKCIVTIENGTTIPVYLSPVAVLCVARCTWHPSSRPTLCSREYIAN